MNQPAYSTKAVALMMITIMMLLIGVHQSSSLIGFNCTHPDVTSMEFGLLPQAECPSFTKVRDEKVTQIQLIQKKEFHDILAYAAKIVRTFHILPCSGYPTTDMLTQRILPLRRSEVMS